MKKKLLIALVVVMIVAVVSYALPCTNMWRACVDNLGYPNAACDALWDLCMALLY